ncbi:hypothetical protein KIN20_018940 [Parelaphostrongylus tenuis]|uniref:Uncharacterized protein n=1 Tax=Parelaphostrongylus tenuis TaxID=148309 RepID=A0AAD5MK62_PARTN|nr:hypothetical protein KIN20_018940 [Parelaphostrongylus tenuis]
MIYYRLFEKKIDCSQETDLNLRVGSLIDVDDWSYELRLQLQQMQCDSDRGAHCFSRVATFYCIVGV